jgi:uncharacterized damage-inducible protein DinB
VSALPEGGLEVKAMEGSPSIAELFTHIHFVRLVFVFEDHPILLLQHMLWHEGYHHGQMKLALKLAGRPMTDEEAGPVTWDVWMRKK